MRNMNGRSDCNGCNSQQMGMQRRNNSCNDCPDQSMGMQHKNNGCNDCLGQQNRIPCRNTCCDEGSSQFNDPLCGMPVGMAYVPWQPWGETYDPAKGLCVGTIFPSLNLPFYGCIPRGCNTRGGAL